MNWIPSTLMAWSFRRGYWFQPWVSETISVEWMTWCGGGPLDNERERAEEARAPVAWVRYRSGGGFEGRRVR
jgi:hypothetical protein